MRKSTTNNMKRIVTIIFCGLTFGATMQLETAEKVARNIYFEQILLHVGTAFNVSEIEISIVNPLENNPNGTVAVPIKLTIENDEDDKRKAAENEAEKQRRLEGRKKSKKTKPLQPLKKITDDTDQDSTSTSS